MRHTSPNPAAKVAHPHISTSQIRTTKHSTLAPHLVIHHQTHHVIGIGIQTCCPLLRLQTCGSHPHNARRNGPSTTQMHHGHHQQHHRSRTHNGHHDTKGVQIDGSTLPLAQMLQRTTSVPLSLASWHQQPCRLCQQKSSRKASTSSPAFFHPGHPSTSMNFIQLFLAGLHLSSKLIS
jgi:hypothetical protein